MKIQKQLDLIESYQKALRLLSPSKKQIEMEIDPNAFIKGRPASKEVNHGAEEKHRS